MADKPDTKALIQEKALELFSQCGFDGVGIRQIAAAVGIKDSSLYKHFPSKQAIYDSLVVEMMQYHNRQAGAMGVPTAGAQSDATVYESIPLEGLYAIAENIFLLYVSDKKAMQFRRMLTIEQFRSSQAGEAFQTFFVDMALDFMSELFARLIADGHFIQADPQMMAYHFYAPMFLLWNQCDREPDCTADALALLHRHISQFRAVYTREGKQP